MHLHKGMICSWTLGCVSLRTFLKVCITIPSWLFGSSGSECRCFSIPVTADLFLSINIQKFHSKIFSQCFHLEALRVLFCILKQNLESGIGIPTPTQDEIPVMTSHKLLFAVHHWRRLIWWRFLKLQQALHSFQVKVSADLIHGCISSSKPGLWDASFSACVQREHVGCQSEHCSAGTLDF